MVRITNEINVWQVAMISGNGFEFRQDVFFSVGKRNFKCDYYGLRHFDFLSNPIIYN